MKISIDFLYLFIDFSMQNPTPIPSHPIPRWPTWPAASSGPSWLSPVMPTRPRWPRTSSGSQVRCLGRLKGLEGLEGWWGWDGFFWGIRGWDASDDSWLLMVAGGDWNMAGLWFSHHIRNGKSSHLTKPMIFQRGRDTTNQIATRAVCCFGDHWHVYTSGLITVKWQRIQVFQIPQTMGKTSREQTSP